MLGFGISNEQQVSEIMKSDLDVDAIVMGSAFIEKITHSSGDYKHLIKFCQKIKNAMKFN